MITLVQGSHYFLKQDLNRAIFYFERWVEIARNEAETQWVETGIKMSNEFRERAEDGNR